jgi:hypothetical protein
MRFGNLPANEGPPTVTLDPKAEVALLPGEQPIRDWPAEMLVDGGPATHSGWLVLTTLRCVFLRRRGIWGGGRVERAPAFAVRLDQLRTVSAREFSVAIGYGDHYSVPGLELNGTEFRLTRGTPSAPVVAEIDSALPPRTTGEPLR